MDNLMQMRIKKRNEEYETCGFPKTVSEFTAEDQMLPMRDGVKLRTVIYRPAGLDRCPALFRRTCYPADKELIRVDAENCALRGYAFVYQFCRGTGGSQGDWIPNIHERNDGIDTVNWLHAQPWCCGIGYWGLSYAALTGWAFADAVKGKVDSWENIPRKSEILYLDAAAHGKTAGDSPYICRAFSLCASVPGAGSCGYTYDPDDPVPTNGGDCTLASWSKTGSLLQEKPGWRGDIISFLSEPLETDWIINGQIEVELWVKTDCENTAFFASIDEMTPEGRSYHIRTSAATIRHELPRNMRYVPGTPVKVTADMSDVCYAVSAGSRIRIDVTSSDFPQYHAHSNQPGDWALAAENRIAHQIILTGGEYPSCVRIPCQNRSGKF